MTVQIDSGEMASLHRIDIKHQPSRNKVQTEWIRAMADAERAVSALPQILQEIATFKLWELDQHSSNPRASLQAIGIEGFVDSLDSAGDMRDLIDLYVQEAGSGESVEDTVKAIGVVALSSHGGDRKSEAYKDNQDDNIMLKQQGTSKAYLTARIARDHPDVNIDDYPSIRQAAIACGIVKVKTAPEQAVHWLNKCTDNERADVMAKYPCPTA